MGGQKAVDSKWVSILITLVVLLVGGISSFTWTKAEVAQLKTASEKKVDQATYEKDIEYLRQTMQELKAENKEAHQRIEQKIDKTVVSHQ